MSCVFAEDITIDRMISFLSVKICPCTHLASIRRIASGHRPPNGDFMDILSMDCRPVDVNAVVIDFQYSNLCLIDYIKAISLLKPR